MPWELMGRNGFLREIVQDSGPKNCQTQAIGSRPPRRSAIYGGTRSRETLNVEAAPQGGPDQKIPQPGTKFADNSPRRHEILAVPSNPMANHGKSLAHDSP
jgi:hypothetical protein